MSGQAATGMNRSHPALKRILGEAKDMAKEMSDDYDAVPSTDDLFDWHFTIRGPPDSAFHGGLYHGRVILPPEYPNKPPEFLFLTPNGRFEVGKKICLSISQHHPEEWQAAWGMGTALTAIRSFMTTPGEGAIGSLDWPDHKRRELAQASRQWKCDICGAQHSSHRLASVIDSDKPGDSVGDNPAADGEQSSAPLQPSPSLAAKRASDATADADAEAAVAAIENADAGLHHRHPADQGPLGAQAEGLDDGARERGTELSEQVPEPIQTDGNSGGLPGVEEVQTRQAHTSNSPFVNDVTTCIVLMLIVLCSLIARRVAINFGVSDSPFEDIVRMVISHLEI